MKVIYPPENYDSGKKIIFLAGHRYKAQETGQKMLLTLYQNQR